MNRVFKIVPYAAVNDMLFGYGRDPIRSSLGKPISERMVGYPICDHYVDDYGYMNLTYNPDSQLVSVTLTPYLTKDTLFIECLGMTMKISAAKDELISALVSVFEDLAEDDDGEGFTTRKYGIKVYCPEDDVETVVIHTRGLYGD